MSAQTSPDEHFYSSSSSDKLTDQARETKPPADQSFFYEGAESDELPDDYVPEREFVLMPLFRRIGDALGLRRQAKGEYQYEERRAEPAVLSKRIGDVPELPIAAVSTPEPEPIAIRSASMEPEDLLGIEAHNPSPWMPEPEPLASIAPKEAHPVASPVHAEPNSAELSVSKLEPPIEIQSESLPTEVQTAQPEMQQVAFVEAAQAEPPQIAVAEELETHNVNLTEPPVHVEPLDSVVAKGETQPAASLPTPSTMPVVPEWESTKAPALQREMAWQDRSLATNENRSEPSSLVVPVKPAHVPHQRPRLVSKQPSVPAWQRIDWSKQFAPKRIAILGAFVMAILMIVGISLARRPASNALPQQTRTLEPGGVTLSTHPAATIPAAGRPRIETTKTVPHRTHRAGNDDGPDVVTHYYGKAKPSPVHQSSVGGVRHYSDMP